MSFLILLMPEEPALFRHKPFTPKGEFMSQSKMLDEEVEEVIESLLAIAKRHTLDPDVYEEYDGLCKKVDELEGRLAKARSDLKVTLNLQSAVGRIGKEDSGMTLPELLEERTQLERGVRSLRSKICNLRRDHRWHDNVERDQRVRVNNLRREEQRLKNAIVVLKGELEPEFSKPDDLSTEVLGLSTRAFNGLQTGGVNTVGELLKRSPADILKIQNVGRHTLREIKRTLGSFGLHLASNKGSQLADSPGEN